MKRRIWIFIFLSCMSAVAWGQSVETLYHQAAQLYINGDTREAVATIETGLRIDPHHPKLQALLKRIKEQQEQQQQQQQQQQQAAENQPRQQDQPENEQQQEQQEQQKQLAQEEEQQPGKESQPQFAEAQEKKELSKEEAERILQALRSKEKENKTLRHPQRAGGKRVEKDW